jgi:small basic protein (TIGR04137 family)
LQIISKGGKKMAQHPSLRSSGKSKQHRSVLKRFEKIEILKKKGLWKEGEDSVFGLPKVKVLRFKVKKEKAQEEAAETPQTPIEEGVSSTEQKPQAQEDKKESKSQKQSEKG